eukprot:10964075-Heterocapsa_arctica.AAC.1
MLIFCECFANPSNIAYAKGALVPCGSCFSESYLAINAILQTMQGGGPPVIYGALRTANANAIANNHLNPLRRLLR